MFYFEFSDLSILILKAVSLAIVFPIAEAQDTTIQEPPVILLHNDAQSLREVDFGSGTSIRLSLVCAVYGEPDYPIITWSSPTDGVEDYAILAANDDSVNVFNNQQLLPNTQLPVTVSILELCNFRPENLTEYLCVAINSNSPRQNGSISRAQPPFGAFAVMYSFASGNVTLSHYEMDSATPTTSTSVNSPSQSDSSSLTSTRSETDGTTSTVTALSSATVAVISTLVVCTVVISAAILASTVIVVVYKSSNKGSRERTRNRNLAYLQGAQTDSDSLYECNAYTTYTDSMYECTAYGGHDRNHQSQQDLSHTYNYIDAPTSPKDKKMTETFAVYQCPAYGAHDVEIPPAPGASAVGHSGITETGETAYNYVEESIAM